MIYHVKTENDLENIKNPSLKEDVKRYFNITNNFLKRVEDSGVKVSSIDYSSEENKLLKEIEDLGGIIRHDGKSVVVNGCSPSCDDCRTGYGSATYILTLACNRDCFFCTNKNQADIVFGDPKVFDIKEEFYEDVKTYKKMKSVAITGGEPLLHPDKCAEFIKAVKEVDSSIQTRIYTNGDLVTEDILILLKDAGLDEIRFGLKPDNNGVVEDAVLDNLKLTTNYIERTMVEMPMLMGHVKEMNDLMDKLESLNIYGVNILEFLYPFVHPDEYAKNNYEISTNPYRVYYPYDYAGGLSVNGSQKECLEVVKHCLENKMKMTVHYCSLENKLTSQVYMANFDKRITSNEYFSPNDFFIKSVRAYGDDAINIKEIFDSLNVESYSFDIDRKILDFHPRYVLLLKNTKMENVELGLSYNAAFYDERYDSYVLGEFLVEKIVPVDFNISEI